MFDIGTVVCVDTEEIIRSFDHTLFSFSEFWKARLAVTFEFTSHCYSCLHDIWIITVVEGVSEPTQLKQTKSKIIDEINS